MMEITQPEERGETYVARELERGHMQDTVQLVISVEWAIFRKERSHEILNL